MTPDNAFNPDVTNTASSYIPIINIDNADEYVGNYAFQLLVHTTSYSTGYRQATDPDGYPLYVKYDANGNPEFSTDPDWGGEPYCEAYNIPHEQILSNVVQDPDAENPFVRNPFVLNPFVRNDSQENPFVQNPFVQNPFVQNSAFAMAPPEGPTETTTSGFTKVAAYPDGTTKDFRAPNSVKLTLRAFQLKPFCDVNYNGGDCIEKGVDLIYDPETDLPSAAVGSWPCLMRESEIGDPEAAACFNAAAADLVPLQSETDMLLNPETPDEEPRGAFPAGTEIIFPLVGPNGSWDGSWDLKNQAEHPDAFAAAENGELTQGYYLCPKAVVDNYPEYLPLDVSYCTEALYQDPPAGEQHDGSGRHRRHLARSVARNPDRHRAGPLLSDGLRGRPDRDLRAQRRQQHRLLPDRGPAGPDLGHRRPAGAVVRRLPGVCRQHDSDQVVLRGGRPQGRTATHRTSRSASTVRSTASWRRTRTRSRRSTTPGSSDLRYKKGNWQFNWDTVGLGLGCYNMRIYQPLTGQLDGPFGFVLR